MRSSDDSVRASLLRAAAGSAPVVVAAIAFGLCQLAAQAPQQPTFRTGTDVIRLDVTVLDKDRHPIRGLTASDFTVTESGKVQRIVAVSEVNAEDADPMPSAWMRFASEHVAANDLADQAGDGRLVALLIDDWNLPWDSAEIARGVRDAAHDIIDQLGPSDLAAVVFVQDAGNTQDFTTDPDRLHAAIDKYLPHEQPFFAPNPTGAPPIGGDTQRTGLGRSNCERLQPTVPAIQTVIARLASASGQRRKSLFLLSIGAPVSFTGSNGCPGVWADEMRQALRLANSGNVNVYGIDPTGYRGYLDYLTDPMRMMHRGGRVLETGAARAETDALHQFLQTLAENTGGRAVINTSALADNVDRIFGEDAAYYLVGYQTSNSAPDGRFRKITVKVSRPGATVLTRSGYWAPRPDQALGPDARDVPATGELNLMGLMTPPGVFLRASALPIARAADGRSVDVDLVLTVRFPAPLRPTPDTLTIVRNIYDADGRPGPPARETVETELQPIAGDELPYDLHSRLSLAPGRYQIRFNVQSRALGRGASIFADVEVPDFARSPLSISGLILGPPRAAGDASASTSGASLPVTPGNTRLFGSSDPVSAFVRVFQAGAPTPAPITMTTRIFDSRNAEVFRSATTLPADAFASGAGGDYQIALPLDRMSPGPHLLSVSAGRPDGRMVREDVVFRIR
jgi:VWFA-related protein